MCGGGLYQIQEGELRTLAVLVAVVAILASCGEPAVQDETPVPPTPSPTPTLSPTPTPTPPPTATPVPTPTPEPTVSPTPAPTPTFAPMPIILPTPSAPLKAMTLEEWLDFDLEDRLDAIALKTSVVRELSAVGPIERRFITQDEARQLYLEDLEEESEQIAIDERLYTRLGIIESGVDLKELQASVIADIVLGMYDSEENLIYVVSDEEDFGLTDELTAAHEYVHALQQLHFDYRSIREDIESMGGNSDKMAALRGLIEGDATLSDFIYEWRVFDDDHKEALEAEREADTSDMSAYWNAPAFIRQNIVYPYVDGPQFAYSLYIQTQDFTAVNAAFERLPESTEQIIHPEKYAASEPPLPIHMPDLAGALGSGWTEVERDVMGELFIRSLLSDRLEQETYTAAAAGWGGDSFLLLEAPNGSDVFVSVVWWDTENDAAEFAEAMVSHWESVTGEQRVIAGDQPPAFAAYYLPPVAASDDRVAFYLRAGTQSTLIVVADDLPTALNVSEVAESLDISPIGER